MKSPSIATLTLLILCLLLCVQTVRHLPVISDSGDSAYKIRQARDFVDSGFASFAARYAGSEIDREYKYFPATYPFVHPVAEKWMYVFPFQYAAIVSPLFFSLGIAGFYIVTFMATLALYLASWRIGRLLNLSGPWNAALLAFVAVGSGLWVYSSGASEHMLAVALCFSGISLLPFYDQGSGPKTIVAGLLFGIAVMLRPESALLAALVGASFVVVPATAPQSEGVFNRFRISVLFGAGFAFAFGVWLFSNVLVTGDLLGLRGREVSAGVSGLFSRISIVFYALVRRESGGGLLSDTPAFALVFLSFPFWRHLDQAHRRMLLVVAPFCVLIPILVPNRPGPQFGERFLLNAYPLMCVAVVLFLRNRFLGRLRFVLIALCVALAAYTAWRSMRVSGDALKLRRYLEKVKAHADTATLNDRIVILRNPTLNTFFLLEDNPSKVHFLADSDESFCGLAKILTRESSVDVAVVHSRIRGKLVAPDGLEFDLPMTMVPAEVEAKALSADLGEAVLEIKRYRLYGCSKSQSAWNTRNSLEYSARLRPKPRAPASATVVGATQAGLPQT